ncbi:MAG TPA: hypothetical protein VMF89_14805 [Polyangiales bacterium]|nr:hypothetical protein [Polyangiales bacterium]
MATPLDQDVQNTLLELASLHYGVPPGESAYTGLLDSPTRRKRAESGSRALHHAATTDAAKVAALLLARGAQVDARDDLQRATPLAWAVHVESPATLRVLAAHSCDVFTMVAGGLESRLQALLSEDATLANAALDEAVGLGVMGGEPGDTPLFVLPDDEAQALSIAQRLLRAGADPTTRNHAGLTASEKARARGLLEVADLLSAHS